MVFFELVNTSSCNRVGDYDTGEEALREVRELWNDTDPRRPRIWHSAPLMSGGTASYSRRVGC